jgi:hypothetical protein
MGFNDRLRAFLRAFRDAVEILALALEADAFVVDGRFYLIMPLNPFMYAVRACFSTCAAVDTCIGTGYLVFRYLVLEP